MADPTSVTQVRSIFQPYRVSCELGLTAHLNVSGIAEEVVVDCVIDWLIGVDK